MYQANTFKCLIFCRLGRVIGAILGSKSPRWISFELVSWLSLLQARWVYTWRKWNGSPVRDELISAANTQWCLSEVPRVLSNRSRYMIVVNSKVGFLMAVLRFFLWRITSPACRKCRQSRIFQCYPPQFSREFPKVSESVSATKGDFFNVTTMKTALKQSLFLRQHLALLSGTSPSSCAVSHRQFLHSTKNQDEKNPKYLYTYEESNARKWHCWCSVTKLQWHRHWFHVMLKRKLFQPQMARVDVEPNFTSWSSCDVVVSV